MTRKWNHVYMSITTCIGKGHGSPPIQENRGASGFVGLLCESDCSSRSWARVL